MAPFNSHGHQPTTAAAVSSEKSSLRSSASAFRSVAAVTPINNSINSGDGGARHQKQRPAPQCSSSSNRRSSYSPRSVASKSPYAPPQAQQQRPTTPRGGQNSIVGIGGGAGASSSPSKKYKTEMCNNVSIILLHGVFPLHKLISYTS